MRLASPILALAVTLTLGLTPLVADEGPVAGVPPDSDCGTLRAIYQRLASEDDAGEARDQLARAILLLPGCVPSEARLQQARTLDGVEVFRAGALPDLEQGRTSAP